MSTMFGNTGILVFILTVQVSILIVLYWYRYFLSSMVLLNEKILI